MKALNAQKKVRYAVVGIGYIAQIAVLPAFKNAKNSELAALVSDDVLKLRKVSKKYKVPLTFSYDEYDALLASGAIDAVYIALPNSMHCDFAVRAAKAGVHVLCEKPLAVTIEECEKMITAARENKVKLMTAYRLHFDEANLKMADFVRSGKLGEPRIFNSVFTMSVKAGDIRLQRSLGGGPLYDIGIYCINAVRYLFADEPVEVTAASANNGDKRFKEVNEMVSVTMKFPQERLASFTVSFGAAASGAYEVLGTKGTLRMDSAYEYAETREAVVTIDGKNKKFIFKKHDQFAPELIYFSKCILENKKPEPSGEEGLIDVRIIQALKHSAQIGRQLTLPRELTDKKPDLRQAIRRPAVKKSELVHASSPHQD